MDTNWIITSASVQGYSHIEENIPCQDAIKYTAFNKNWGIVVISDGAGSCENSHIGSSFAVNKAVELFSSAIYRRGFRKRNKLLRKNAWRRLCIRAFGIINTELILKSKELEISHKSLSCTLIVLIYSPWGIMSAHIGDGRAAYSDSKNDWKPAMVPYSGNEVGTTVFITSDYVHKYTEQFIETNVIRKKIRGFALMTDGCEKATFECYQKHPDKEKYFDPNRPFPGFFKPVSNTLVEMYKEGWQKKKRDQSLTQLLTNGNKSFANEGDDKTMLIGLLKT